MPNSNKNSVIQKLSKEQYFYVSLISELNSELVNEKIITPMQQQQIAKYIKNKLNIIK